MMIRRNAALWLLATTVFPGQAYAQSSIDLGVRALAGQLSEGLQGRSEGIVALADLTNLQGIPTELGRYIAERLAIELVLEAKVTIVDRANTRRVLAEHRLIEDGFISAEGAKALGQFTGADALVTGSITEAGGSFEVLVKAISIESLQLVAAGRTAISVTPELRLLAGRRVVDSAPLPSASAVREPSVTEIAPLSIAQRDFGPVRISLMEFRTSDSGIGVIRRAGGEITATLEISSMEAERPVYVALNSSAQRSGPYNIVASSSGARFANCGMGTTIQAKIISRGVPSHSLPRANVTGIEAVGVGCTSVNDNPSGIAGALSRQEEMGGRTLPGGAQYAYGTPTELTPGRSLDVTLTFVGSAPSIVRSDAEVPYQLTFELVVGVPDSRGRIRYSLKNVVLDVAMSGR